MRLQGSPVITLGYMLQHIASTLYRQSDQVLQERLGIGMSQFKLLMILQRQPHMQQRQLADSLGQTEASISRQIKLMCDKGLLAIQINPDNRREHITMPTAKAIKVTDAALETLNEYHKPVFDQLDAKQQDQLRSALQAMHAVSCQSDRLHVCDQMFETK